MRSPKISICLPCLNTYEYIEERIRSIQKQSEQDYEVVVADSYSTDGTWERLLEWASIDPRVSLKQVPKGLYQAWNDCLARAKGRWIYFATSDDTMVPWALQKLLHYGEKSGCDIVTSADWMIDQNDNDISIPRSRLGSLLRGSMKNNAFVEINCLREFNYGIIIGSPTVSITQMLIRRHVFERHGMFPIVYGSIGDYYWQMHAIQHCRICRIAERLGAWRVHAKQATSSDRGKLEVARITVIKALAAIQYGKWKASTKIAFGFAIGRIQPESRLELRGVAYAVATATAYCPKKFTRIWQWMVSGSTILLNMKPFQL
jgi:glycosyltransferase involved in cell wall biosynthesis